MSLVASRRKLGLWLTCRSLHRRLSRALANPEAIRASLVLEYFCAFTFRSTELGKIHVELLKHNQEELDQFEPGFRAFAAKGGIVDGGKLVSEARPISAFIAGAD